MSGRERGRSVEISDQEVSFSRRPVLVSSSLSDEVIANALTLVREQQMLVTAGEQRLAEAQAAIETAETPPADDDPLLAKLFACKTEQIEHVAQLYRLRVDAERTEAIIAAQAMNAETTGFRYSFAQDLQQASAGLTRSRLLPLPERPKPLFPPDMPTSPGGGLGWGTLNGGQLPASCSPHSSRAHSSPGLSAGEDHSWPATSSSLAIPGRSQPADSLPGRSSSKRSSPRHAATVAPKRLSLANDSQKSH